MLFLHRQRTGLTVGDRRLSGVQTKVLLTTGAMNPPHRGHAQLLHQARERLEEAGYQAKCGVELSKYWTVTT